MQDAVSDCPSFVYLVIYLSAYAHARARARTHTHTQVSLPALRDLLYSFGQMFLGGDFMTMHSHIHVVTDNMVAGTSAKCFIQFWNCYTKKRFLSFDYGPRANLRIYGTGLFVCSLTCAFMLQRLIDVYVCACVRAGGRAGGRVCSSLSTHLCITHPRRYWR